MINKAGLALIKQFEGEGYFKWYPDPAHGWKVPTVGYGHTDQAGKPFYANTKSKTFTQKEIDDILIADLERGYEPAVKKYVKVPLNENQYAALVSFVFNLGAGNFAKSTLLKKINAKDFKGAVGEFAKWNKAGGKVLKGLTRRRAAEAALFKKPTTASINLVEEIKPITITTVSETAEEPRKGLIRLLLDFFLWFIRRK